MSETTAVRWAVAVCALAVVLAGLPAASGQSATAAGAQAAGTVEEATTVSYEMTATFRGVAADGTVEVVSITVPDRIAGSVSVGSASASAGSGTATVVNTAVVDGPDADGTEDTLAVRVRVSGGGRTGLSVTVAGTGSEPSSSTGSIRVADTGVRYAVDADNPLVRAAIESRGGDLTVLNDEPAVLAVTPPEGATLSGLSVRVSEQGGLTLSVPLQRLDAAAGVAVSPTAVTLDEQQVANVTVTSTGDAPLSLSAATLAGEADAFDVSVPTGVIPPGGERTITVEHVTEDGANATLTLVSNATNSPATPVSLTALPAGTTVEMRSNGTDRMRNTTVSVRNAPANESVSMPVEVESGNVTIENMSVTLSARSDFNMTLRTGAAMRERMPAMNLSDKALIDGFVVEHSFENEDVTRATLTVTVPKAKVEALNTTDPDEVALFRHGPGGWIEANTTLLGSEGDRLRYRVVASGYSEWATAGKQANFRITDTGINVSTVQVGEAVTVSVRITNHGEADGRYLAELILNDVVVDDRQLTIAAGGTGEINFERQLSDTGTYEVRVNDVVVDKVTVAAQEDRSDDGTAAGETGQGAGTAAEETQQDAGTDTGADRETAAQQSEPATASGEDRTAQQSGPGGDDDSNGSSPGGLPLVPLAGAALLLVAAGAGIYVVRS